MTEILKWMTDNPFMTFFFLVAIYGIIVSGFKTVAVLVRGWSPCTCNEEDDEDENKDARIKT